jgi:hypothetical protein
MALSMSRTNLVAAGVSLNVVTHSFNARQASGLLSGLVFDWSTFAPNDPRDSFRCCCTSWHLPNLWENVFCQWFYQFGNLRVPWVHTVVEHEWGRICSWMHDVVHREFGHWQEVSTFVLSCVGKRMKYVLQHPVDPFRMSIGLRVVCRIVSAEPSLRLCYCGSEV